jgi:hypothetical protein
MVSEIVDFVSESNLTWNIIRHLAAFSRRMLPTPAQPHPCHQHRLQVQHCRTLRLVTPDKLIRNPAAVHRCHVAAVSASTTPVEQPSSLLCIRSAYTTFLHVRITARPIDPLVNSLFNRPQREKYVMQPREEVSDRSLYIPRGVSDF